jgi:hypothetical protein
MAKGHQLCGTKCWKVDLRLSRCKIPMTGDPEVRRGRERLRPAPGGAQCNSPAGGQRRRLDFLAGRRAERLDAFLPPRFDDFLAARPADDFAPRRADFVPRRADFAPLRADLALRPADFAPRREALVPRRAAFAPPRAAFREPFRALFRAPFLAVPLAAFFAPLAVPRFALFRDPFLAAFRAVPPAVFLGLGLRSRSGGADELSEEG